MDQDRFQDARVVPDQLLSQVFGDVRSLRGVAQYTWQLDRFLASSSLSDQQVIQVGRIILEKGSSLMKAALSQFLLLYERYLPEKMFRDWMTRLIEDDDEDVNVTTKINVLKILQARPDLFSPERQTNLIVTIGKDREWGVRSFLLFDQRRLEWFLNELRECGESELVEFLRELLNDSRVPDFATFLPIVLESQLGATIPVDIKLSLITRAISGNQRQHQEAAKRHGQQILHFLCTFMNDEEILEYLLASPNDYLREDLAGRFLCQRIVDLFLSCYDGDLTEVELFRQLDRWAEKKYFQKIKPLTREEWKNYLQNHLSAGHLMFLALLCEGLS